MDQKVKSSTGGTREKELVSANDETILETDIKAKFDQTAWNLTPSQAATTVYDARSMADAQATNAAQGTEEDARSVVSRYTYSSEIDATKFVKHIGGRAFNTLSETYFLPTDDDEWTRLNKQHVALLVGLGGLYPDKDMVKAVLTPGPGETKRILDVGCGTGVWALDMAREFPHAAVTAVDLAPVPIDAASLPSNVQFEIDDVNKGLEHFKDMFDLVHIRLVGSGLQNFAKTMQDVEECLKPGGIALFMDVDYDMYSEDQRVYIPFALEDDDVECERSWFQRIVYEMRRGAMSSGKSDIYGMSKAMDEGLWEHPLMDPETCKTGSLYMPIGPWAEASNHIAAQQLKYVGALMRQDLMSAHRAGHAVMKRIGWPPETLAKWSSKADEQMMKTNPRTWIRMRYAWGRRRAGENQPAPALATPPGIHADDPEVPYPHFNVYGSKEESLAETKLRNRGKDLPVPPLPIASVTPTPAQT